MWSLESLDGIVLQSGESDVTVDGVKSVQVANLDFDAEVTMATERDLIFVYSLWHEETRISMGVLPFTASKHLSLVAPAIAVDVTETDTDFVFAATAKSLARFVELSLEGETSPDSIFSDNYFDLPAGRTVMVTLPKREGMTLDTVRDALRVKSLIDSH